MCRHRRLHLVRDAGMATVVVLAFGALLGMASGLGLLLAGAAAARHRAGAAADLAAIAAAQHRLEGPAAACRAAARIARADGARVVRCRLAGGVAEIQVSVGFPGPLSRLGPARATARAGRA